MEQDGKEQMDPPRDRYKTDVTSKSTAEVYQTKQTQGKAQLMVTLLKISLLYSLTALINVSLYIVYCAVLRLYSDQHEGLQRHVL